MLTGATIGGRLDLSGATLSNPGGLALNLESARITHLGLRLKQRPEGIVNLTNTRVVVFDDEEASWPAVMRMRGFTYETLANDEAGVRCRLGWLGRHEGGYTPQLYDQLAWVFATSPMIAATERPPVFVSPAYTLDVLLPIVDLGQEKAWNPIGGALYLSWVLIAAGWVLTTAVVTGVLKRT